MAELQFDATQYEPSEGRPGPIPEGWYTLMATKSNLGPTRDGTGARLTMNFSVQGGDHNGRTIIHGFNVRNQNDMAQRIGLEELSALCHSVNMLHIQNTEQLHNIPFKAKVKIEPAQMETDPSTGLLREKYAAKNEISTFKPMSFVIPDEPAGAAATAPVAPAAPVAPPAGMPPISQPAPPVHNQAAPPPPGYPQPGQPIQPATPPPHTHAAPVAPPAGAPPVQSAPPPVPTQVAQPWEQAAPPVAPQQAPTAPAATAPPAAPPDAAQQAAQVATPPWEQGAPAGTAPPSTPPWQQ